MRVPQGNGFRHALVGYVTLYTYYAYPANLRPRVRSVIVGVHGPLALMRSKNGAGYCRR